MSVGRQLRQMLELFKKMAAVNKKSVFAYGSFKSQLFGVIFMEHLVFFVIIIWGLIMLGWKNQKGQTNDGRTRVVTMDDKLFSFMSKDLTLVSY